MSNGVAEAGPVSDKVTGKLWLFQGRLGSLKVVVESLL